MWQQLRSAVDDVKEFSSGAISEVSQGVTQGRKLAVQTATKAPHLAGAAASFVEGRRKGGWGPSGRTSTSSLDEANAVADAIAASGPSSSRSEGRSAAAAAAAVASSGVAGGSGTAEGLAANTAAREQQQQRPASAAMQLTRLNSMDSVSLTDEGRSPAGSTRGGSPLAGSPREPHFQYSRPRPASAAHPDGHSSPLRPATAVGDSALGHINTIMGNSSPAADQDPRPGQPIGHASDTTSPGEQQQQRQQQPVLAGSLQGAISAEPEPATELPRSLAGAAVPLRPSKAAPGDVPDDAADNWGTHAASPPTSHLEGDHPAGAASQPNVSNRDDARQASPAEEGDLRPSDSPGRASAAAPTVGEPASTSLEQPQAGSPGRNRQPAGARDRSRSGSRPLPVSTGVGGGSGSGATAAAGQGGSAAESDPGAEPAPLTGAEAAALRRQLAGVQQQLAVERQLVRASAREKADIDASLAELTRQVQERDEEVAAAAAEAAGLRAERHAVDAAVEELRTMLMQSVAERTRLAAEAETAEQRIATAEQESETRHSENKELAAKLQAAEAALDRQREASEALSQMEVEGFQARLAEAEAKLAEAQAAAAAATARAEASDREREAAEAAAAAAERLRQDIEAEAEAAAAVADAERLQRAAAAGEADALRADADRRAKAFNTAVAAAVGRVKAGLEAERDALAARLGAAERRIQEALQDADASAAVAATTSEEAEAARAEAAEAAQRAAAAEEEAHRARSATHAAQQATAEATAARDAAVGLRRGTEQQLAAAQERAAEAEARAAAAVADLQTARAIANAASDRGAVEAAMWRERAEAATAELRQAATAAGTGAGAGGPGDTEALARHASEANAAAAASANDAARARQQVAELERVVGELRAAARRAAPLRLPAAADMLASLGLDSWKDSRLGPKVKDDADLEVGGIPRAGAGGGGLMAVASAKRREVVSQMRGVVSARTWLLVGYLGVLHLMVMVSFTRRHDLNLDTLCADWAGGASAARTHGLPGT